MTELQRPRINAILDNAGQRRVTLVVAPAGSGKSIGVRQHLTTIACPFRLFDLRQPEDGLAQWLEEEGKSFAGVIAIDALEAVGAGQGTIDALIAAIERGSASTRWILVSRSTARLPLGSWLGYGVAAPIVSMADLRFTSDEVAALAEAGDASAQQRDLDEITQFTEGWAIASTFAVRTLAHRQELRSVRAETLGMMQRFLGENVDEALDPAERELLEFCGLLPSIDVRLLELAGFGCALQLLEGIQTRTALVRESSDDRFSCDSLFVEFLRRRVRSMERSKRDRLYSLLGATLEASRDAAGALHAYAAAGRRSDVLRLLESDGFDLIDRARTDAVTRAIEALDERTRRSHPHVLALRGVAHASKGRPVRAESLLRRSLACAVNDRGTKAVASLRLAVLVANRGDDVSEILNPIAGDPSQSPNHRAEAFSLLAAQRALAGDVDAAMAAAARVDELLPQIDHDVTRAKVLQRIGVTAVNTGNVSRARAALEEAADLARELELHSVASRACSNLCNLALQYGDDLSSQLRFAQAAVESAVRGHDVFDLQTGLLQLLRAEMQRGNDRAAGEIEERLINVKTTDETRSQYIASFRAIRWSWGGRFADAHRSLIPFRRRFHYEIDRLMCDAYCSLFLALDGRREASLAIVKEALETASKVNDDGLFSTRSLGLAQVYCAIAEAVNGRCAYAERICRRMRHDVNDGMQPLLRSIAIGFVTALRSGTAPSTTCGTETLEALNTYGHGDAYRLLSAVEIALEAQTRNRDLLSAAEIRILRLLGEGLSSKEIALRTGRSVFTVRVHIANAISKLKCHGRLEAIATARRQGIID
jgi:ATP/maltotriose-dependent transcriptional regulator MalT